MRINTTALFATFFAFVAVAMLARYFRRIAEEQAEAEAEAAAAEAAAEAVAEAAAEAVEAGGADADGIEVSATMRAAAARRERAVEAAVRVMEAKAKAEGASAAPRAESATYTFVDEKAPGTEDGERVTQAIGSDFVQKRRYDTADGAVERFFVWSESQWRGVDGAPFRKAFGGDEEE